MSQSLSRIHIHAIFSTKSREPVLHESWRDELFRVLGGAVNNCGCQSLVVDGVADHVHILFELSRTLTVARAMKKIKSPSSAWVNQSRVLSTRFAWQNGYAAFSVSHSNLDAVRMYIQRQEEQHQRQCYQDELRGFRHQISPSDFAIRQLKDFAIRFRHQATQCLFSPSS